MRCTDFSDPDTVVNMLTLAEVKLLLSQIEDSGRAPDNPYVGLNCWIDDLARAERAACARPLIARGDDR